MQKNMWKCGAQKTGFSVATAKWLVGVDVEDATKFHDLQRLEKAIFDFNDYIKDCDWRSRSFVGESVE